MSRPDQHTPAGGGFNRGALPYLYLLPTFLIFVPFVLAPFLHTVGLSCFDWDGLTDPAYRGLANYREALGSPLVRAAFVHALILILFFGVVPILLALLIAAASANARVPGDAALRTLIFLPQVMSTVVVGVTWSWIVALDGPVNQLLQAIGLGSLANDWLGSFTWALPTVGVIGAWALTGLCMALFVAGLQQIPASLYDAAAVDGAGRIREFFAVTLPGLRGPIAVALTVTVISALRAFDIVFVTTRGGPGTTTMVPGFLIYRRAFEDGRIGSAAAIAVLLSLIVFACTFAINRYAERRSR
jgi:raffinose/stachyose/melibiose transport system permease protein